MKSNDERAREWTEGRDQSMRSLSALLDEVALENREVGAKEAFAFVEERWDQFREWVNAQTTVATEPQGTGDASVSERIERRVDEGDRRIKNYEATAAGTGHAPVCDCHTNAQHAPWCKGFGFGTPKPADGKGT